MIQIMNQELHDKLFATMTEVSRASLERHSGERFYSVAIYTSGEYSYLIDSLSTSAGLERVAARYLEDSYYQSQWGTLDDAMRELKWSPSDSPYHEEFGRKFNDVDEILNTIWDAVDQDSDGAYRDTCREIHETCLEVLRQLRQTGLFPEEVVFNLLMGDQSDEERLLNAEAINPPQVVKQFQSELEIDPDQLEALRQNRREW